MNLNPKRTPFAAALLLYVGAALAPASASAQPATLNFQAYLDAVENHSLELAAQRETVTAAQAGIGIAGLRPDPELTYETSRERDRGNDPRPVSRGPELSWTLETGGKRKARIRAARSYLGLTEANLEAFRHRLYSDATSAFADACRNRQVLARNEQTLEALNQVVRANEVRHQAGDIGGVEWLQSRVERDQFQAQVAQARADHAAAQLTLAVPLGQPVALLFGDAALDCHYAPFAGGDDVEALVLAALRARDDVLVARATLTNASDNASLVRADRWVDPTIAVGLQTTRGYPAGIDKGGAPIEAIPRSRVLTATFSVPLPLSRFNRGELVQANAEVSQATLELRQAELAAETDVRAAHHQFLAARENLERYRGGVLADAQRMLEGIRLSYRNGASSLLELLDAQRSADDIHLAYLQAESDLAVATVELQLAVGQRPQL